MSLENKSFFKLLDTKYKIKHPLKNINNILIKVIFHNIFLSSHTIQFP